MGGLAWEGDGRELTGKTGAAASPARSPAAELELQALGSAGPGKRTGFFFFYLKEPESHQSLHTQQLSQEVADRCLEMGAVSGDALLLSPREAFGHSEARRPQHPISVPASLARPRVSSVSVGPRLARRPRPGFQRAAPPRTLRNPLTFSVRQTPPPSQTSNGARAEGAQPPSCEQPPGTCRPRPPASPRAVHSGPRRRPLPPPGGRSSGELWGRGGRGAQARTPARRALRAGLCTHRARGARGPEPPSAPLTPETRRPRAALAPPSAHQLVSCLSRPLDAPAASPRRPRCAVSKSLHLAGKVPRLPRSPRGLFSLTARGRRRRTPQGCIALKGKSP